MIIKNIFKAVRRFSQQHISLPPDPQNITASNINNYFIKTHPFKIKNACSDLKFYTDLQNWFQKCYPTILKEFKYLATHESIINILISMLTVKFHRKAIGDPPQSQIILSKLQKQNLKQLILIYRYFIDMKYENCEGLEQALRRMIMQRMKKESDCKTNDLFRWIHILLMGKTVSKSIKNQTIEQLHSLIKKKVESNDMKEFTQFYYISSIYQQSLIDQIQLGSLLESFSKDCNKNYEKLMSQKSIKNSEWFDKNKSVFERIFVKQLIGHGYNFNKNVIIKQHQYDFIISGCKKVRYYPLSKFNIHDENSQKKIPPIDPNIINYIHDEDVQFLPIKKVLRQHVVVNINGPVHYINSDVLDSKTITCSEQFKIQKLPLYGYNKFKIIDYSEWQKLSRQKDSKERQLEELVTKAVTLKPTKSRIFK